MSTIHSGNNLLQTKITDVLQDKEIVLTRWRWLQFLRQVAAIVTFTVLSVMAVRVALTEARVNRYVAKEINLSSSETHKSNRMTNDDNRFIVPKIVWVYRYNFAQNNLFTTELNLQNIKYYSNKSLFTVHFVNHTNYHQYLATATAEKLATSLDGLRNRSMQNSHTLLNESLDSVIKTLIILTLLNQNGGVAIDDSIALTEDLSWLQNIIINRYVNIGNPSGAPQIFCFHWLPASSVMQKQQQKIGPQLDKYMIRYPGLLPHFIAAQPSTVFLEQVLHYIYNICYNAERYIIILQTIKIQLGSIARHQFIKQVFTVASHLVIQTRQKQIQQLGGDSKEFGFAIDNYGVYSINSHYFLDKLGFVFKTCKQAPQRADNFYHYIAKLSLSELQNSTGPLRYALNYDPFHNINVRLEKAIKQDTYEIFQQSLIHQHLFLRKQLPFIKKPPTAIPLRNSTALWDLPKILWVYWDKGIENAEAMVQICSHNMQQQAEAEGFTVNYVSDSNLHQFIDSNTLLKIENTIHSAKMIILPQTKSDFYRLALIAEHGGVYLDATYYFVRNFSWITHISEYPPNQIFNRFDQTPRNLMLFHPIEGAPFNWTFDTTTGTKMAWHLAYQSSLIMSYAKSQFIIQWFEQFVYFVTHTYDQTEQRMHDCNIFSHKWTEIGNRYLSVMDAVKCVVGRRQIDIQKHPSKYPGIRHANQYYGLWNINGFSGQQKFRYMYNLGHSYELERQNNDNILLYRYPVDYTEGVIGPINCLTKFYGESKRVYPRLLKKYYFTGNWSAQVHPDSFFSRYLFNPTLQEFYLTDGTIHLRQKPVDA